MILTNRKGLDNSPSTEYYENQSQYRRFFVVKKETDILKRHLAEHQLKLTRQRQVILETFLGKDHVTAEDLYREISKRNVRLGLATVYRTLNLLCECGLAQQRHFGDARTLYDNVSNKSHHDHLICTQCGRILEFENPAIERLQEKVARENKFTIYSHKLELYGLCRHCKK